MGTVAPDFETQGGLDERFASVLAHVAANDTPLIDERAATRGRSAMEGGDERAGAKGRYQFERRPRKPGGAAGSLSRWLPHGRLKRRHPPTFQTGTYQHGERRDQGLAQGSSV